MAGPLGNAQPYVTGPAPIYINTIPKKVVQGLLGDVTSPDLTAIYGASSGSGSGINLPAAPLFLGHAERTPRVEFQPRYSNLFVDLAGQEIPFDLVKQGGEAVISIDMTRFQESTYRLLQAVSGVQGANFGDYGTLMMSEGVAYELWLPFPYTAIHPAMADQYLGFHFLACVCINDNMENIGTVPRRQRLVWRAIRKFIPSTYQHVLCNQDFSALGFNAQTPLPIPG